MCKYESGDKVRTTCEVIGSTAYSRLESFRAFASDAARSIPEGTRGVVVEHAVDLIVSFEEPGVAGRTIDPSAVERIEEG